MMAKSIHYERSLPPQNLIETTKSIFRCGRRTRIWFFDTKLGLARTFLISLFLLTSAFAQEQQRHAYSEYTFWYGGAFGNGHAFANTMDARNYQFENRYERLIYWKEPFAVRWVFDATSALVADPRTGNGHRVYTVSVAALSVHK